MSGITDISQSVIPAYLFVREPSSWMEILWSRPEGLYRLALHFKNLKRAARRFVIEHGDHQPPGIPSEGVKVRSVLF